MVSSSDPSAGIPTENEPVTEDHKQEEPVPDSVSPLQSTGVAISTPLETAPVAEEQTLVPEEPLLSDASVRSISESGQ
jgi:hypothetical protein